MPASNVAALCVHQMARACRIRVFSVKNRRGPLLVIAASCLALAGCGGAGDAGRGNPLPASDVDIPELDKLIFGAGEGEFVSKGRLESRQAVTRVLIGAMEAYAHAYARIGAHPRIVPRRDQHARR